eukprot:6261337-Amphidinium_carterae.2
MAHSEWGTESQALQAVEKRSKIMNRGAPRVADGIVADTSTGPVFAQRRRNASEPSFHSVAAA